MGRNPKKIDADDVGPDDLLALALASGRTQIEAAKIAGVSVRTVQYRMGDPGFQARMKVHAKRLTDEAFGVLAELSARSFRQLDKLVTSSDERISLEAIKLVSASLLKVVESRDIQDRLEVIEESLSKDRRRS